MGSIGGPEVLVILLVALIVLGPARLPDAARQAGKALAELRRMSSGFQAEIRDAIQDPVKSTVAPPPPPSADVPVAEPPVVNPWASSFPDAYAPEGAPKQETPPAEGPSFT